MSGTHIYAESGSYGVILTSTYHHLGDPITQSASSTATVAPAADLRISVGAPASVKTGGTLVYVINVSNAGPSAAANLRLTDQLPYGTSYQAITATGWTCQAPVPGTLGAVITCVTDALADGASTNSSIAVKVRARPNRGALHNVATITSDTFDGNAANNTASASTTVTK